MAHTEHPGRPCSTHAAPVPCSIEVPCSSEHSAPPPAQPRTRPIDARGERMARPPASPHEGALRSSSPYQAVTAAASEAGHPSAAASGR
eukprot:6608181-Prymnesium_polylepis.1